MVSFMGGSRKFCQKGPDFFLKIINVFHRGPYELLSRSNWVPGSNCFSIRSVPVFLRKPIVTCDLSEVGVHTPCSHSGSAQELGLECFVQVYLRIESYFSAFH